MEFSILQFVRYLALVLHALSFSEACEDYGRILHFAPRITEKALKGHVIKNLSLEIPGSCQTTCYLESDCVSYNLGPLKDGRYVCELSNSTTNDDHDLVHRQGFIYRETENACTQNSCSSGLKCQNGFTDKGYRCIGVNGAWSEWGDWGECSETCGNGTQERSRSCTSPPPSGGGADCSGDDKQTKYCNFGLCTEAAFLFPKAGTTDYVIKYGMPNLTSLTACFWMKSIDKRNQGTPLSYAVSGANNGNELLIHYHNSFQVFIGDSSRATSVSARDGNWHHICVTWENGAGTWKLYKDGVEAANGQGLNTGYVIRGGGALVLGQEQDSVGGRFDAKQSFTGELTGVNIWDRVIEAPKIANLAKSCVAEEGNVFKWSDFTPHVKGEVQLITLTCPA